MTCIRVPGGIVTLADEVERDPAWDFRTGNGRELEVLAQVRTFGGFSVFWACEKASRARAITRLEQNGKIIRKAEDPRDRYPWCVYILREKE